MNEDNVTKDVISEIAFKQQESYSSVVDDVMSNKREYLQNIVSYDGEIFALEKIIKINKRAGNKYAI